MSRRDARDSSNTAWRNVNFRGFADYMATPEFETGLEQLQATASWGRAALMCAEAVPWRCHRSLVADALTVRGAHVEHIISIKRSMPHHIARFAAVTGKRITYPGEDPGDERLATMVPFQQLSLDAGVAIVARIVERFGTSFEHDTRRFFAFPTAQTVAAAGIDGIKACGMSHRKADTLHHRLQALCSSERGSLKPIPADMHRSSQTQSGR